MKYFLFILCLLPLVVSAQPQHYALTGYMAVPGGESFTYKLALTDSAGQLDGYSLTFLQPTNDIKATVTAIIDRIAQTLIFKETGIVYNHGFQSNAIMCLANATLKYKNGNKGKILTGSIRSSDITNTDCGGGTITFVNEDELERLFNPTAPKNEVVTPVAEVAKPAVPQYRQRRIVVTSEDAPAAKPTTPVADEITTGTDKTYTWHTDTVVIDIWDGGRIDNDIVTLQYNGAPILAHHILTAAKKQVRIPLSGQAIDVLTIVADNEGNEPPNTANIILHDGATAYDIVAYNDRHQSAVIKIKKAGK